MWILGVDPKLNPPVEGDLNGPWWVVEHKVADTILEEGGMEGGVWEGKSAEWHLSSLLLLLGARPPAFPLGHG